MNYGESSEEKKNQTITGKIREKITNEKKYRKYLTKKTMCHWQAPL